MRPAALLPVLAMLPFAMGLTECTVEQPPVSCDSVEYFLTPDGVVTLTNFNDEPITVDVTISANICTSQGCTWTGSYVGEVIGVSETREYVADQAPDACTDQFCCASGYTGNATATVAVIEGQCTIGMVASKPTCGGDATLERWIQ